MATVQLSPVDIVGQLNEQITGAYPFIKSVVFDPNLEYQSSVIHNRVVHDLTGSPAVKNQTFPLLSWNRSALKPSPLGRVASFVAIGNSGKYYNTSFNVCALDYKFALISTNMPDIERFEVDWYSQKGIRQISSVKVAIPDLGTFDFSVIWELSLEDLSFNAEGNYYKTLVGMAHISGTIFSADLVNEDDLPIIKQIDFRILDCRGNPLAPPDSQLIIPNGE